MLYSHRPVQGPRLGSATRVLSPFLFQMYSPSGDGDWGCWPPGKRSLRPSAGTETERERKLPSLSADRSVKATSHMSSGLKLLTPRSEDHRDAVSDERLHTNWQRERVRGYPDKTLKHKHAILNFYY